MAEENIKWDKVRKNKWATSPPPTDWDPSIRPISMPGLSLFGIDESTGKLHWDGKEIVVRKRVSLTCYQTFLASVAAFSAFVVAFVEVYRVFWMAD